MRMFGEGSVFMDKRINIISDSVGKQIVVITDIRFQGKRNINWEQMRKQKQMQHKGFLCFFSAQQIEDGKKIIKENIMLMQNTVGTDLLQDLHFLFTRVILGNLKGSISSG